ncbi:MAG TPA: hypothetical protein ENK19_07665, partial [Acidobacteria bacterium]|nr:hypothetical protein [Acidobacteriota bacterium]
MAIERHERAARPAVPAVALIAGLLLAVTGPALAGGGAFRRGFPEDRTYAAGSQAAPALPAYLGTWVDPVTLTGITRISRYSADWDWYPHHAYSKIEPWNMDQTLYKFYTVAVFDARSHRVVRELPGDLYPTYWSNVDPDLMYSFREDGEIKTYRVSTGQEQTLGQLTGYDTVKLGPGEGNLDISDRVVALVGKKGEDLDVIVVDLGSGAVVTTRTFPGAWGPGDPAMPEHIDWVSVSQSGQYVVIDWDTGPPWDPQPFDGHFGVEVYDTLTMTFERRLVRYGNHGDLGFTPAREEVYVQFWGDHGTINAYHLDDGRIDVIATDPDFGWGDAHLSCRNIFRPGWAYLSTDPSKGGMILAVKLDGSGTVELFGHHESSAASYAKSPMPVPSPDGRRVMFKSDFGNSSDPDEVYEFEAAVSDAQFIYRNGRDIDVQVSGGSFPTFSVTRSDGTVLREPFDGERFFADHSGGALQISYGIEERPGGVDIEYTIANPTGTPQPPPDLLVEGLAYAARTESDSLYILNTSTHQYLHRRFLDEPTFLDGSGNFQGWGYFDINGLEEFPYPRSYSPVIV